jgi:hypothetical protein
MFSSLQSTWDFLNLKQEALTFYETLVDIYQSTRSNIPEDLNVNQSRCTKLKPRIFFIVHIFTKKHVENTYFLHNSLAKSDKQN